LYSNAGVRRDLEIALAPRLNVMIAGAGIGGLTAALALLQRNIDVTVFEQSTTLGELGAGVQLGPDGTRILIALGLERALEGAVCEAERKEVRLWNTGQVWPLFDLGEDSRTRFGAPYWFVHRGDLHRALRDAVAALKPDAISVGRRCVGGRTEKGRAIVDFADGGEQVGDILIGADGVHSALRSSLFGEARPNYTGIMAWRGLIPTDRLPAELRRPVGTNWIGPGGHVITYPVRSGELLNFVAVVERSDWIEESWSTVGTSAECLRDFAAWHADVHLMIEQIDTPYKWALIGRDPMQQWVSGRCTLLGDACHPTLPFLAHGAIMAIEDGLILARCLEAWPSTPEEALGRYEKARLARTTAIVLGSAANAKRFHNPALADPVAAAKYVDTEWAPDKVRTRYDWLFEYDATQVSLRDTSDVAA
jgi:salicylate hydroxylase